MRVLQPGIFRTAHGYRVVVRLHRGPGGLKTKRYPADESLQTMKQWRVDQRQAWRALPADSRAADPPAPASFAADATTYLETVRAMPSIADRRLHIQDWVALFGDRPRAEITSAEIRAQRDRWLTVGPRRDMVKTASGWTRTLVDKPLAPASVNRRLRALENLWTVLDGPDADNPVRDVPEADEPDPIARGATFAVMREILEHMPHRTQATKGRSSFGESKTRARIAVEMWTGLAHSQLAQLRPHHCDFARLTYIRPRRQKGRRGARNRTPAPERPKPLLPQAATAIKHFFAIGAEGKFARSSVYKSFKAAIRAANAARIRNHHAAGRRGSPALIPETLRPYDVKHTFASEAYAASGDQRAVQELLGLSRLELTDRYAHAAIGPAASAAAAKLALVAGKRLRSSLTTRQIQPPRSHTRPSFGASRATRRRSC